MAADPVPTSAIALGNPGQSGDSYVEWSAIWAGAVLAAAISFVLLTFGAAIGLSVSSPFPGEGASLAAMAIASGLWVLWVEVASFMAGGYLAGRMRRRLNDSTEHESHVRDGAHGLLVWATGVILGGVLTLGGLGGATATTAQAIGAAAHSEGSPIIDATARDLFRPQPGVNRAIDPAARGAALGVIANDADTPLSDSDRAYAANIVMDQTGVPASEAQARVDAAHTKAARLTAEAQRTAEIARKTGIIVAFFLAASLLVSAAAAYIAAGFGGHHRDKAVVIPLLMRRW